MKGELSVEELEVGLKLLKLQRIFRSNYTIISQVRHISLLLFTIFKGLLYMIMMALSVKTRKFLCNML